MHKKALQSSVERLHCNALQSGCKLSLQNFDNRIVDIMTESLNQPAIRSLRVLRPLKLVSGVESECEY